jgi:hypothetical protein
MKRQSQRNSWIWRLRRNPYSLSVQCRTAFGTQFWLSSSTVPKADDHAARLARIHRLCAALDDVHVQAQRACRAVTAEASRAHRAALKFKPDRRRSPRNL